MPKPSDKTVPSRGEKEPPVSEEMRIWLQAILTEQIDTHQSVMRSEFQEQLRTVAAANSFQSLMEHTVDQLAAIAAPLSNIGLTPAKLDEKQTRALERIREDLARPPEAKLYLASSGELAAGQTSYQGRTGR